MRRRRRRGSLVELGTFESERKFGANITFQELDSTFYIVQNQRVDVEEG